MVDMEEMQRFPQKLQELRKKRGLYRSTLSELCGLSKNMVGRYERGEISPSIASLIILADCLDVSVDTLLGR